MNKLTIAVILFTHDNDVINNITKAHAYSLYPALTTCRA